MNKRNIIILSIVCAGLSGCNQTSSSEGLIKNSVRLITKGDSIETIIAIAECQSPQGTYSTEVHSGPDDYTYFKQVYTYRDKPFEGIVVYLDSGFQVRADSLLPLSASAIQIIKGHEFHEILVELQQRFHAFQEPESMILYDKPYYYRVSALDKLNKPVELFFNGLDYTMDVLTVRNPEDSTEIIRIEYSDRRKVQGFILPMHVEIIQGDKRFVFDYTSVKINDSDFKRWAAN